MRSAKGAARSSERSELFRAALRFARVPQNRKGCGAHLETDQKLFAPHSVLREFSNAAATNLFLPTTNRYKTA